MVPPRPVKKPVLRRSSVKTGVTSGGPPPRWARSNWCGPSATAAAVSADEVMKSRRFIGELYGFKVTRLRGCKATRRQGYEAARRQGCEATRLQGDKAARPRATD